MFEISISNTEDGGILAKAYDDKVLGSGAARVVGQIMTLDSIQVNLGERRRGIGTRLLKEIIEWAKDQGATEIVGNFKPEFQDFEKVKAFYESFYIEVSENGELRGFID